MNRPIAALTAAALAAAAASATPARAHHSAAMFDFAHQVELRGVVKSVDWVNPHILVFMTVPGKEGEPAAEWSMEGSSPGVMSRAGWSKRSFNPGDNVTVMLAPLRNGAHSGSFRKATLANGQTLTIQFKAGQ